MGARNSRGVDSASQVSREGASPGPSFTVLTPPSRSATWALRSPLSLPSGACHSGITLFRAPLGGAWGGRIRVACHKAVGAHGGERVSGDGPSFAACSPLSVCWWVFLGGVYWLVCQTWRGACPQAKSASPAELCHSSLPSIRRSLLPAVLSSCLRELWHSFPHLQR